MPHQTKARTNIPRLAGAFIRYQAMIFSAAAILGCLAFSAFVAWRQTNGMIPAILLTALLCVLVRKRYSYDLAEQRHYLHGALPISRREAAGALLVAQGAMLLVALAIGSAMLHLADKWTSHLDGSWGLLLVCHSALSLVVLVMPLVGELTARPRGTKWWSLALGILCLALGGIFGGLLGSIAGKIRKSGLTTDTLAIPFESYLGPITGLLYFAALIAAWASVEMYHRRESLAQPTTTDLGLEKLRMGRG